MSPAAPARAKATLSRIGAAGPLETVEVRWNPSAYRLRHLAAAAPGPFGRESSELSAELFVDATAEAGAARDATRIARTRRGWLAPPAGVRPEKVLFVWGSFRFAGILACMDEEWIRFDPDGTPVRGRIRIVLRS